MWGVGSVEALAFHSIPVGAHGEPVSGEERVHLRGGVPGTVGLGAAGSELCSELAKPATLVVGGEQAAAWGGARSHGQEGALHFLWSEVADDPLEHPCGRLVKPVTYALEGFVKLLAREVDGDVPELLGERGHSLDELSLEGLACGVIELKHDGACQEGHPIGTSVQAGSDEDELKARGKPTKPLIDVGGTRTHELLRGACNATKLQLSGTARPAVLELCLDQRTIFIREQTQRERIFKATHSPTGMSQSASDGGIASGVAGAVFTHET